METNQTVKNCPYCGGELSEYATFCPTCKARIPEWAESEEYTLQEQSEDANEIIVPKPGELVGDLTMAIERVLSGEIEPAPLLNAIPRIRTEIANVFIQIGEELSGLAEDAEEYKNFIMEILNNISKLFDLSFSEMEFMNEDGNSAHLKFGVYLAQRAEIDYIELLKSMKMQSKMDAFANEIYVIGTMASKLHTGQETQEGYKTTLTELKETVDTHFAKSQETLNKAFDKALQYTGSNNDIIKQALLNVAEGVQELSAIIINLHNPEETREALEEVVKTTVDEMEEKGELGA